MIIDQPGKVTDRILLLGRKESCVYLLDGKTEYALIGGGTAHIVPDLIEQLKYFKIEDKKIKRILILHSHFDHCGIVPFLKNRWPWVKITASFRAKELLSDPKVVKSIALLNRMALSMHGLDKTQWEAELGFTGIDVEETVTGKDMISCGDLFLKVLDVPGHSSCSIAVYVEHQKAMFASDAGGVPIGDRIFTSANSNFDMYQASLKKMAGYQIDVFLAEHYGARTGEDAHGYLKRAMAAALKTRNMMEASYARTGNINESVKEITDRFMEIVPDNFMPEEIISMVAGQMLRYLVGRMQDSAGN